ncbi:MAG: hypothetical protein PHT25_11530, partial [Bacteroidales bacterium]|nr:hypothetical protein [Bacteroidales bacterium]
LTSFYTQTLPTTENGKLYIYLGHVYSTNALRLTQTHPIYEYRNGRIQLYDTNYPFLVKKSGDTMTGTLNGTSATFSGTVGIGTPTASTHATTKAYVDTAVSGAASKWTTSGTNTYLTATGNNVGIGTTNPVMGKIHIISGDNKDSGPIIALSGSLTNQIESGRIRFLEFTANNYQGAFIHYNGSSNALNIGVHEVGDAEASSDINAITILRSNGNVGINTTSPAYKLDVNGTARFTGAVIVPTPSASNNAATKGYVDSTVSSGVTSGAVIAGSTSVGYLKYNGTTALAGALDGGTTSPSGTNRLNYGGYLYATQLYDGGTRVAISSRSITAGDGITGGGDLTANRSIAVNSTVIRTTGNQTLGGIKTFSSSPVVITPTDGTHATNKSYVDTAISSAASKWTTSGTNTYLTATGNNVGIGTTSPLAKLEVEIANSGNDYLLYSNSFNNRGLRTGNGSYAGLFGFQNGNDITSSDSYGTILSMNAFYNGTNWYTLNGWIRPTSINIGQSGSITFFTETNSQSGTAGNYTPTERMRITTAGNVGIGTTSPGYKLDVSGTGRFTGTVSVGTPTASNHATTKAYVDSMFSGSGPWTLSGTNIYATNVGYNVGIGTTSPGGILHVKRSGNSIISLDGADTNSTPMLIIGETSMYGVGFKWDSGSELEINKIWNSNIFSTTPTQLGAINASSGVFYWTGGNFGIGQTAPAYKLDVSGTGRFTSTVSVGTPTASNHATTKTYVDTAVATAASKWTTSGTNTYLTTTTNNVGIGTTTPGAKLSLYNSGDTVLSISGNGDSAWISRFANRLHIASNDMIQFGTGGQTDVDVTISSSGNLGIGTASPTYRLEVAGGDLSVSDNSIYNATILDGEFGEGSGSILGFAGDKLIRADSKYTVTCDKAPRTGSIAQMFDGNGSNPAEWDNVDLPVTCTIEFNSMKHYWEGIAINFPYGRYVSGVKIEKFYDNNSSPWNDCNSGDPSLVWATVYETTTNNKIALVNRSGWGNGICKIRITLSGTPQYTDDIRIGEIAGWQYYYGQEGAFVRVTGGDTIYGSLNVTGTLGVATPTASNHATTKAYVDSMFSGSGPWTLSGTNIYATNTAHNVGIGTTSPSQKLTVAGNILASNGTVSATNFHDSNGVFNVNLG